VPRLANPVALLRWNTDKRYLGELAAADVTEHFAPPPGDYVIKPTVGAAAAGAARFGPGEHEAARTHVAALQDGGKQVLVQPYLAEVEVAHETSVLLFGGHYSHGARKGPILSGPVIPNPEDYDVGARQPSPAELAVAAQVVAAAPTPLLYARVDLLPGPDGPLLLELEATEPYLFLCSSQGAADRFAAAIMGTTTVQ